LLKKTFIKCILHSHKLPNFGMLVLAIKTLYLGQPKMKNTCYKCINGMCLWGVVANAKNNHAENKRYNLIKYAENILYNCRKGINLI
jgi:hypothetical protein